MLKGKYSVLAVLALLSGAVVMFADDEAASGAVAVQEPEFGSTDSEYTADSHGEDGAETILAGGQDTEDLHSDENALAGDSAQSSRPADSDPV